MPSPKSLPQGLLIVSVDLEVPLDQLEIARGQALDGLTRELVRLLDRYQVPATWAVSDPVHSAATERIRAAKIAHELAICGDSTWVGSRAGRSRFARELARRTLHARSEGIEVSSLICSEPCLDDHLDLVIKHGITAVRGPLQAAADRQIAQPCSLRYGLWELPGSTGLPQTTSIWRGGRPAIRRQLDWASRRRRVSHLVIDAAEMIKSGPPALRSLERVLRHAQRLADTLHLHTSTMSQAASAFSRTPSASPQRSILKRAG